MSLIEMMATEAARSKKFNIGGNVIKGAHLVGLQARNIVKPNTQPYVYKEAALKAAVPLYNNVDIYVGHGVANGERSPLDKIGFVTEAGFKEGEGVFGDLVLNEKHPAYAPFMWWAANKPEKLAMSHVARTQYAAKENAMVEVLKVYSVDFVSDASTTQGLFKEGLITDKIDDEKWLAMVLDTFDSLRWEVVYSLGKPLTQQERAVNLVPVIKDLLAEVRKLASNAKDDSKLPDTNEAVQDLTKKENNMEYKDIVLDELKKQRKDLVDAIAVAAVESHIEIEESVKEALATIPADSQTPTFQKLVREAVVAGDSKLVDELVADRKTLLAKQVVAVESAPPQTHKQKRAPEGKADKAAIVSAFHKRD